MNHTARLILEASTGVLGDTAKQLANAWTEMAGRVSDDSARLDFMEKHPDRVAKAAVDLDLRGSIVKHTLRDAIDEAMRG